MIEWLEPWAPISAFSDETGPMLDEELAREVGPGHPLFGVPARAIARGEGDDVLFRLLDGSERVAMVHLTWKRLGPESPPWPHTVLYRDLETWVAECMRPDHEEFFRGG